MNRKLLSIFLVSLIAAVSFVLISFGSRQTLSIDVSGFGCDAVEDFNIELKQDDEYAELTDVRLEGTELKLDLHALKRGRLYIDIQGKADHYVYISVFVHTFGVITTENVFGYNTGCWVIPIAELIYLVVLLASLIKKLRADVKSCFYSYKNILMLGVSVFVGFSILYLLPMLSSYKGLIDSVLSVMQTMNAFSSYVFPVALIFSILIAGSNIRLMRREGRNWRNMLGFILGAMLFILTLTPTAVSEATQWLMLPLPSILDVHNQGGIGYPLEMMFEAFVGSLTAYLECILFATIVFSVRAARKIPAFDRDFILILGCQVADDGTLTPLLKSRADRALEFARMQEEATGKQVVFVPSGGQGPDEAIAEGDAIRNYLLETGVPENRILTERASVNTEENIRYSMDTIRASGFTGKPKLAFSTTNYHVFRAGMLAAEQGVDAEGIGSPTKRYFWINAFICEFVASLTRERRRHVQVAMILLAITFCMALVVYFSNQF